MSHRSQAFEGIIKNTEKLFYELMNIPQNYHVLFMQSGGVGQFAAIPLNLLAPGKVADYVVTGSWSKKAAAECARFGKVNHVLPKDHVFTGIPSQDTWNLTPDAAYLYYCANETIEGVEFDYIPESKGVPLVCDMSSCIMSRKIDISKFAIIFAGAQKNLGCAGVTVVIIRNDLLGRAATACPSILNYQTVSDHASLYNTPSCYSIYITKLVLEWIKDEQGGLDGIERRNKTKAETVYKLLDSSDGFYKNSVELSCRSKMNVVFRINAPHGNELEAQFIKEAKELGMIELKGHRSIGGIRISLYNGISIEDMETLCDFMKKFRAANQK